MKVKSLNLSATGVFLFVLLLASPALAQMGPGGGPGGDMAPGMMQGYGFALYDSRFEGFESMTFEEAANTFGVSVEDAISDLGLPEDMDTQLTVQEIEEQYGVSGEEIASYMVINMQRMQTSFNARERLLMRQQAVQAARGWGMGYGMSFMQQGRFAYGNFTSFSFDEEGVIEDFAVGGDQLFDSVTVSGFDYQGEQVSGAAAFYEGADSQIFLHDNPMGVLQIMAFADKTVVFDLADEVEASLEDELSAGLEDAILVKITKNNFEGYLVVFKNFLAASSDEPLEGLDVKISGDKVTVTLVENSIVMFRASPMQPAFLQTQYMYSSQATYMHQVLNREIAAGRVGAELALRAGGDNASVVNYTPMGLQVRDRDRDRIVLEVQSDLSDGRVITINVDNETIDLSRPERLRLRYDGEVIERAASIDELFAGGNRPLCYLLQENGTATMAVYIPEFSEHEIVIDLAPEGEEGAENVSETEEEPAETEEAETAEEGEAESTPAFEFGFAAAGLAAAYGLRRRK